MHGQKLCIRNYGGGSWGKYTFTKNKITYHNEM